MALTRKFLKAMGIEDEKIDQIIEAHTETVSGLKDSLDKAQAEAKNLPTVQKELDEAREALKAVKDDGWKEKHDKLKKELEDYKADVSAKEAKAAKEAAAKAYYQQKGITGAALAIAMRGSGAEIDALELDKDGKPKDTKGLDALLAGDFSGLVSKTHTEGAKTSNPPANTGSYSSRQEIMAIKDRQERRAAIAAHMDLFQDQKGD